MARALVDTTVLFAAAYRRDSAHEDALPILRGINSGSLPEAVDMLDRIEENIRFHVESLTADQFDAADGVVRLDTATNPYDPN